MIRELLFAGLVLLPPPAQLVVSAKGRVVRVPLEHPPGEGPFLSLNALASAVGGKLERADPWVTFTTPAVRFRFLAGTQFVMAGTLLRALPAASHLRGDTLTIPLSFVAELLADPIWKAWNWTPNGALLAEGPAPSTLTARPAATPSASDAKLAQPTVGLRAGHRVTIDAGHGGTDPGNPGRFFPAGVHEKHVTLAVSLLLRDELKRRGVQVTMTRTTDTLIDLGHRAPRFCAANCDLFVSVHVNSLNPRAGYERVRGFETYFLAEARTSDEARVAKMENEAVRYEVEAAPAATSNSFDFLMKDLQRNEFSRQSAKAAELVQSFLLEVNEKGDKGVKQAGFAVLNTALSPAILVELGYSTNREDARQMSSRSGQEALAASIADAIVEYLKIQDVRSGDSTRPGGP